MNGAIKTDCKINMVAEFLIDVVIDVKVADKKTIGYKPDCFSLSLRERLDGGEGEKPFSLSRLHFRPWLCGL